MLEQSDAIPGLSIESWMDEEEPCPELKVKMLHVSCKGHVTGIPMTNRMALRGNSPTAVELRLNQDREERNIRKK